MHRHTRPRFLEPDLLLILDHARGRALIGVISVQPFAESGGLRPYNAVVARVVILLAPKYLAAKQVFFQSVLPAGEGLTHYKFEEALKLVGLPQMPARKQCFELAQNLLGAG